MLCCCMALCVASARAESRAHTILVNVSAECALQIVGASSENPTTDGAATTQTIAFRYKVRTGAARGQGRIVLQFSGSEDYPANSRVDYQTDLVGPGTALSGSSSA